MTSTVTQRAVPHFVSAISSGVYFSVKGLLALGLVAALGITGASIIKSNGATESILCGDRSTPTLGVHVNNPIAGVAEVSAKAPSPIKTSRRTNEAQFIQLCQAFGPPPVASHRAVAPPIRAVDCDQSACSPCSSGGNGWGAAQLMDFGPFAQGEYVGHERLAHVPVYRLRVDDQLECLYRLTRDETSEPYQINVGDEVEVESFTDPNLNRKLIVQPDGSITLRLLGQVKATRQTVAQLRDKIEKLYIDKKFYHQPAISVTPLKVNTKLDDLRNTVDNRSGVVGGQGVRVRITPEGTITLPAIGTVPAQGLTLEELKTEIDQRYAATIKGIEVTPVLSQRAARFVYVLGEVKLPGRYTLEGPTTVMQSIALAGSWNVGANLRQVVIFRRGDDWRLLATMVDLQGAMLMANQPCPAGEIWLNDSDVVIVPKSKILLADDFINLVFTRGIYGVLPVSGSYSFGPSTISN